MPTGHYDRSVRAADRTEKRCPVCRKDKPVREFNLNHCRSDGRQTYCAPCMVVLRRTTQRASDLRRLYGLTPEAYDEYMATPCDICGDRATHLDHDHVTGAVRGGLCAPCNKGLGHFRDDPVLLLAAAAYLEVR